MGEDEGKAEVEIGENKELVTIQKNDLKNLIQAAVKEVVELEVVCSIIIKPIIG